jgi:predicted HicB family RNase H-like nuclease
MRKRKDYFPIAVGVRIDEATRSWLESAADQQRMSLSRYVRQLLEREAQRDLLQEQHREQTVL